jgi:hypothetical protein
VYKNVNISLDENDIEEGMWKMYFDGASSWEGSGVGVLFVSPSGNKTIPFSFRL